MKKQIHIKVGKKTFKRKLSKSAYDTLTKSAKKKKNIGKRNLEKVIDNFKKKKEKDSKFKGSPKEIQQKIFVREFLVDFNASRAARAAGYSESVAVSQASRLLGNVGINHAINEALEERLVDIDMRTNGIIRELTKIYKRSMQEVEVKDMWGNPTGVWRFDAKNALKALELIGKHLGMFPTSVKHSNDPENPLPQSNVIIYVPDNGRINVESKDN